MAHQNCSAILGKGNPIAVDTKALLVTADRSVTHFRRDSVHRTLETAKVGVAAKPLKGRLVRGQCVSTFTKAWRETMVRDSSKIKDLKFAKNSFG